MKTHRGTERVLVLTFSGFLFAISGLGIFLPQTGFSESENRYLQKHPEFTWNRLMDGSFGKAYEDYLSDQFPGRNCWVGMRVMAERAQGKTDVNQVYFGKDDYLIEKFDTEEIENERLESNLNILSSFVNRQKAVLGEDHIRVMMIPSASQVLVEKLPHFAVPYDQHSVADRLIRSVGDSVPVAVEEALKTRREEEIYYRTDHHWTALGAYYGYEAWANSMGIQPWSKEMFQVETAAEDFYGTVYSKVNIRHKPDSIELYLPGMEQKYQVFYDGSREQTDTLYHLESLKNKDKYAVYLNGNHGLTEIRNLSVSEAGKGRRLLVIKDSFANSFAPFVIAHFETVYLLDLRYFNEKPEIFMESNQVTDLLVLYQIPGFSKEKTVSKLR